MTSSDSASSLIEQLQLKPHPEGGWYRETWRAGSAGDGAQERAAGTAILFLLKSDEASHWHRVDADELWFWQAGDPLELAIAIEDAGPAKAVILGGDAASGQQLQGIVPAGAWQAARPASSLTAPSPEKDRGYSLVSCVVVPGFEFAGFELAPKGWEPGHTLTAQ